MFEAMSSNVIAVIVKLAVDTGAPGNEKFQHVGTFMNRKHVILANLMFATLTVASFAQTDSASSQTLSSAKQISITAQPALSDGSAPAAIPARIIQRGG